MATKIGLIFLIVILGALMVYFVYQATQDDYSSGFLSQFTDSGFMIGHVVTKALSKGDSAVITFEELFGDEENLTEEEKKKKIVIG
ncbi:hypothetical protein KY326_03235 [Candidatus Woesearchaeota archaeon]|nr:hypothetical protein [Candidatus Woesearchaeota archaeon]